MSGNSQTLNQEVIIDSTTHKIVGEKGKASASESKSDSKPESGNTESGGGTGSENRKAEFALSLNALKAMFAKNLPPEAMAQVDQVIATLKGYTEEQESSAQKSDNPSAKVTDPDAPKDLNEEQEVEAIAPRPKVAHSKEKAITHEEAIIGNIKMFEVALMYGAGVAQNAINAVIYATKGIFSTASNEKTIENISNKEGAVYASKLVESEAASAIAAVTNKAGFVGGATMTVDTAKKLINLASSMTDAPRLNVFDYGSGNFEPTGQLVATTISEAKAPTQEQSAPSMASSPR